MSVFGCNCSTKIKNLETQINQILPLLVQKAELDTKLTALAEILRANMSKAMTQLSNETARSLVQNVRSGNESINFIQEIVTRIKALQMDLKPATWETRGLDRVAASAEIPKHIGGEKQIRTWEEKSDKAVPSAELPPKAVA